MYTYTAAKINIELVQLIWRCVKFKFNLPYPLNFTDK